MITVNSILFSNSLRPSQPATNRLVGNAGDVVVATINLTTTATLNDFIFYVNCVPNNMQLYNSSLVGGLFSSVFNSLTNNANCFYTRNGGVIAPASPRSFDNSNSIVINSLGGFVYEIVHTFILAPILRENELDNDIFSNPSYYSNSGLKYVFKLDSINNGITVETTDDVNLETLNIIRNGSVSGWGTSLGAGAINYNLVVTPNLIDINSNTVTTHTAQIKKLSGAWLTSDLISYRLQAISEISGYDFTQSLLQNTKFDFVTHNVGTAAQNGTNGFILACSAAINGTDNTLLDVTFSIAAGYGTEFAIFFGVSRNILAFEHQNVLATYGTAIAQGSNSQVEFVNYAGFNSDFRIGFINWYNQTFIDEGFNHLRAYRKDDNEVFFGVRLTNLNARFVSLECGFKNLDTNQFLTNETFNFDFTTTVPLVVDRGYIRKSDNPKKYIQVAFVGDRYEFRYGFNAGSEFLASSNIVFEANVRFVDSNGFALTNTIRSPRLELGQYDVTQNTIAEPQVLASPIGQPKFYIVDGSNTPDFGTEYDGLVAGQNMLLVATFQDNNLNDLQANEIDLAGFFVITTPNEIKEIERYFFSTYQSEPTTPFQAINGHTAGLVKVTKIDVKTVTLSAIINYNRLIAAFPNQRDLCIVSRIDKPQPPSFAFFKDISLHFTSSPSGNTLITNPTTQNWINQEFVFDGNHVAADFRFKINPTGATSKTDASWSLVPYLDVSTFESTPVLTGYTVRIECIDLKGKTDILGCITFTSLLPTAMPFSGTHFRSAKTALTDFIAFYREDLSIVSVTALNTIQFYNVRTNAILNANSNLTNFNSLVIANLNADLALSPQKYAHYHLAPRTLTNTTTTITGNFGAANREVVEYISPSKYDFAPFLTNPLCWQNDNINDTLIATDLSITNALNFVDLPDGDYITFQCVFRNSGNGSVIPLISISDGNNNFMSLQASSTGIVALAVGKSLSAPDQRAQVLYITPPLLNQGVYTVTATLRKRSNAVGGFATKFFIEDSSIVVNGLDATLTGFNSGEGGADVVLFDKPSGKISFATPYRGLSGGLFSGSSIYHAAIFTASTPPTREFCRRYALGDLNQGQQYQWGFGAYSAPNTFNSSGVLPANPAIATNHSGSLSNLFL